MDHASGAHCIKKTLRKKIRAPIQQAFAEALTSSTAGCRRRAGRNPLRPSALPLRRRRPWRLRSGCSTGGATPRRSRTRVQLQWKRQPPLRCQSVDVAPRSRAGTRRTLGLGSVFARRGCARLGPYCAGVQHVRRGPCNVATAGPRRRPRHHGRAAPVATATSRPRDPRKRFPRKRLFNVYADPSKRLFTRFY